MSSKERKATNLTRKAAGIREVPDYQELVSGIGALLETARRTAARVVNSVLASAYWDIGRRIVEYEQSGAERAEYGKALMERLARDLTARYGRGFSVQGLYKMRGFYLGWQILPTPSGKLEARAIFSTVSGDSRAENRQIASAESAQALVPATGPVPPDYALASATSRS